MGGESDALTRAREALARHNAPRCPKKWRSWESIDRWCPCELADGHTGPCGADMLADLEHVDHLRVAFAEVDRLQAEVARLEALMPVEWG